MQTKRKGILLLPLLSLLTLTSLFSCGENRWPEYYPYTGRDLWIDSIMREEYLWSEEMPTFNELNYFQAPATFLKKAISTKDKNYSSIDTLSGTLLSGYGFDYALYRVAGNDTAYNALITYVVPDSPASEAGLQRGEWIMQVDDNYITRKKESLLTDGLQHKLQLGKYAKQLSADGEESYAVQKERTTALPAARPLTETSVPVSTILSTEAGHVGYILCNNFLPEAIEPLAAFARECRDVSVQHLVLDLRYNDRGSMESVSQVADLLAPAASSGQPFATLQYSTKQSARNGELLLNTAQPKAGVNLNLPTLYILTGNATAGAAEMLINGLKPYMEVILIGSNTKGVPYGLESFSTEQFRYTLNLVVCEIFNALGTADYSSGFKPDVSVSSLSDFTRVLPLGNPDEELLHAALSLITDTPSAR
ncbi:MAG: peptidase S41 [Bacteroides sp.]|nr:peptidase S41 [Bacteroides sp.]